MTYQDLLSLAQRAIADGKGDMDCAVIIYEPSDIEDYLDLDGLDDQQAKEVTEKAMTYLEDSADSMAELTLQFFNPEDE